MNRVKEHRDVALMLLVARSLSDLPWSVDEDSKVIAHERVLWAALSDTEKEQEQKWLQDFWAQEKPRRAEVSPAWGDWAEKLSVVEILDEAFGPPADAFRPYQKGPLTKDEAHHHHLICDWLWTRGFHAISAPVMAHDPLTLIIPSHRVNQEADRLLTLLARNFPKLTILPFGTWDTSVQMRSSYDPVTGTAFIEIRGLDDSAFEKPTT